MGSGVASQVKPIFILTHTVSTIKFFFETLHNQHSCMNIKKKKKCNKKIGSPCLLTRQKGLKLGYFYRSRVKNSNHLV